MDALTSQLQNLLTQAVERSEIAGGNLLVLKNGQELAYAQAGYADMELGRPFDRDTIVRLYSMTKPVTAAAAMLLVQRGELDLGAAVGDYLSAYRNLQVWEDGKKVPARRNVTIKDLLNMTSGLAYPGTDEAGQESARVFEEVCDRLYGDEPLSTMEIVNRLGRCALAFQPGSQWMYGTSADILGGVIETVSGKKFGQFLKEEFFDPLGMADTAFYVPEEKQPRLAKAYECIPGGMRHYPTDNLGICYTMHRAPAFESGGAGLCSTVDDYAKFATMLIRGGDGILTPATVEALAGGSMAPWQLESAQRSWESMQGLSYGNLMRHLVDPGAAMHLGWQGEYGWDGWLGAYFCNSPANGISVLFATQRRDAGTLSVVRKIRNVLYANL